MFDFRRVSVVFAIAAISFAGGAAWWKMRPTTGADAREPTVYACPMQETLTMQVRIEAENPRSTLEPGMFVDLGDVFDAAARNR
jgi:hypothetical protein